MSQNFRAPQNSKAPFKYVQLEMINQIKVPVDQYNILVIDRQSYCHIHIHLPLHKIRVPSDAVLVQRVRYLLSYTNRAAYKIKIMNMTNDRVINL